jgi:hypothetical protein
MRFWIVSLMLFCEEINHPVKQKPEIAVFKDHEFEHPIFSLYEG